MQEIGSSRTKKEENAGDKSWLFRVYIQIVQRTTASQKFLWAWGAQAENWNRDVKSRTKRFAAQVYHHKKREYYSDNKEKWAVDSKFEQRSRWHSFCWKDLGKNIQKCS